MKILYEHVAVKCQNMKCIFCKVLSLPNAADSGKTIGEIREGDLVKGTKSKYPESKALCLMSRDKEEPRVPVDKGTLNQYKNDSAFGKIEAVSQFYEL